MNFVSVIIPCYNEKNTILIVLEKIHKLDFIDIEIIIIDDGSYDGTKEILKSREKENKFKNEKYIFHNKNLGKGSAIQSAQKKIESDIVIIQDADLEYDPNDYEILIKPFIDVNADVVFGSRFLGGNRYVRLHFFWHSLANKILTFLCNLVSDLNMTDMETCFKMIKSSELKNLNLIEKRFGIEPELTIKLAKKKLKFFEVPISYNGRSYEKGKKIRLKDAFRAVYCIFKYSIFK